MIEKDSIDHGKGFDFGNTSEDYAEYRDIYPGEFYKRLLDMGLCIKGQKVLDIGTGTGVLPRNLYQYGADFTGTDISENQIMQAKALAEQADMKIDFQCIPAEECIFPTNSFDVVTACQCFTYFNHMELAPYLHQILKPDGRFVVLYMAWLPYEDVIAGKSEELVLKYSPLWTGCGEQRHQIAIPDVYFDYFTIEHQEVYDINVSFTRNSWNGRMRSCRGIGASLPEEDIKKFDIEHTDLLIKAAPENFSILHYVSMAVMRKK